MTRLRPIDWLPKISLGLTLDQLARGLRCAECGGSLLSVKPWRQTDASLPIRAGVDILTISRRLEHNKPSVTLDTYGHLIEGADAAAAKAIALALS